MLTYYALCYCLFDDWVSHLLRIYVCWYVWLICTNVHCSRNNVLVSNQSGTISTCVWPAYAPVVSVTCYDIESKFFGDACRFTVFLIALLCLPIGEGVFPIYLWMHAVCQFYIVLLMLMWFWANEYVASSKILFVADAEYAWQLAQACCVVDLNKIIWIVYLEYCETSLLKGIGDWRKRSNNTCGT